MSSEERAENLAKSIATGARNPHYVKWESLVKHVADVLRAERLAVLEEAAGECEKRAGEYEFLRNDSSPASVAATEAHGALKALRVMSNRIRALKGEK